MVVEAKEDFSIDYSLFNVHYGTGMVKKGTRFEVVREPVPEKKMYKLKEITKFDTGFLYIRKSFFNQNFIIVDG